MSRARISFDNDSDAGGSYIKARPDEVFNCRDEEIAQLTRIKSDPHYVLQRMAPGREKLPVNSLKMLMAREGNYSGRGKFSSADCCHVLNRYLPVTRPSVVDKMNTCVYTSQFSADGSRFVAAYQNSHIRIYNVDNGWKVQKDIRARLLRWTITDTCLSPDRRFLVYSSISPVVQIVDVGSATSESVANITEIHEGLSLSSDAEDLKSFGIFSVKFSTDGREIVAASNDNSIYVYDIEARRLSLRIPAHMSDVNTVCFADESGHIIYSGSDDSLCKVWDRRCFASRGEAAGVLMGHLEGITFIDSRGDGRYLISNGKDQAIKLWDIRKMSSNVDYTPRPRCYQWDYRWMEYPEHAKRLRHPNDLSLATYKGHSVLQTLIRCYFSPEFSTGQKYIYTGSADSSIYIYDLVSGAQVARLDYHDAPVRDCNWHPFYPTIASSSWDGIIAKWEFPDNDERPKRRRRRQPRVL